MKKIICLNLLALLALSCSIKQDPLASFPAEIRNGIQPDQNTVLKPIPRGAIRISSLPKSPLVFNQEKTIINISVRFLQGLASKYEIDVLNLNSLPGTATFDKTKNQLSWVPDLSSLPNLFAYIPIHIRVNFTEPRPLYIEHTIYARAYRALKGLKLQSVQVHDFKAGSAKALVTWVVKDLDTDVQIDKNTAEAPRLMLSQKGRAVQNSLLPYLKFINPPKLQAWKDKTVWVLEAYFDLSKVQLSAATNFFLSYNIFSSFGKNFGLVTATISVKPNVVLTPPKKPKGKGDGKGAGGGKSKKKSKEPKSKGKKEKK